MIRSRTPLAVLIVLFAARHFSFGQESLPDAPLPQGRALSADVNVAFARFDPEEPEQNPATDIPIPGTIPAFTYRPSSTAMTCGTSACTTAASAMSCCDPNADMFQKYLKSQTVHVPTPKQKLRLAARNIAYPFNLLTIAGTSAISIASDADSPYGPGFKGWAKLSGVSLTQDMTGEFFGTFLIPSIAHQDPHFHRLPNASLQRRIAHCIYQVVWSQSDTGKPMFNYATVLGTMADEAVSNAYVPYRQTGWDVSAARVSTALATDPIGNFIAEFLPDVASHVNIRVVFVQRIINRIAVQGMSSTGP